MGATQACSATKARVEEPWVDPPHEPPPSLPLDYPAEAFFRSSPSDVLLSLDALRLRMDRLEMEMRTRVRHEELEERLAEGSSSSDSSSESTQKPGIQPLEERLMSIQPISHHSGKARSRSEVASYPHLKGAQPGSPRSASGRNELTAREKVERDIVHEREMHRDEMQEQIRKRLRRFQALGKSDDDGNRATDLDEEERNSLDEDFLMKKYAMDEICNCKTAQEILVKCELLIEEDWLDKVEALPGNLFCLGAFGEVIPQHVKLCSSAGLKAYSKCAGLVLVVLIQLLGPMLIFLSRMPGNVGVHDADMYHWRCHPLLDLDSANDKQECPSGVLPKDVKFLGDWEKIASTKGLGIVFILAFILNGLFRVLEEMKTWRDLYNTFRFLDWKNEEFKAPGAIYLGLGAFVNCWVVTWSCLDMYVVAGASENPQDLLLDALGLLFLFRLDDVGGDLCFIDSDDWPGLRLAWIYNELVHPWDDAEFDEDKLDRFGTLCLFIYRFTITFLCIELACIPVLVAITPFIDIAR